MPPPLLALLLAALAPLTPAAPPPTQTLACRSTDGRLAYLAVPLPPLPAGARARTMPVRLGPAPASGSPVACLFLSGGAVGSQPAAVWRGGGGTGGGTLSLARHRAPRAAATAPPPPSPSLQTLSIPPAPPPLAASLAAYNASTDLVLIYRAPAAQNATTSPVPVATVAANTTTNTTTPTPPPCDTLTLLTGPTGALGIPRYSPRTACGWVLDPGYAPIRLTVSRFETEPGYDSVFLMALSPAGLRTKVAELSGKLPAGRTVVIPATRAFVGFLSDSTVEGGGWELTWDRGPACAAVSEVVDTAGILSDGAGPAGSPNGGAVAGTRCEWQVRPPAGPIRFTLTRLSLPVGASLAVQGATRAPLRLLTGERGRGKLPTIAVPASARGPTGDDAVFVVFEAGVTSTGAGFALRWELEEGEGWEGGGGGDAGTTAATTAGAFLPRTAISGGAGGATTTHALGGPPPPPPPFKDAATLAREEEAAAAAHPNLGWDGFSVPPGAARAIIACGALAGGVIIGTALGCIGAQVHALVVHGRHYGGRWSGAPRLGWARALEWVVRRGRRGGAASAPPAGSSTPHLSPPGSPRRRRAAGGGVEVGLTALTGGGGGGAPPPPLPALALP